MLLNISIAVVAIILLVAMLFKVEVKFTGKKELVINGKKIL